MKLERCFDLTCSASPQVLNALIVSAEKQLVEVFRGVISTDYIKRDFLQTPIQHQELVSNSLG